MPINREPESVDNHAPEESTVRRTPLDQDDAYELADHEFTLVAEDAGDDSPQGDLLRGTRGWPYDEHTAPWSTLPPLPAWATNARALLEPPTLPRPLNDETPTLVEEGDHVSASALRALRTEIGQLLRDADARGEQIDQLERALAGAVQARAEAELKNGHQGELAARAQGQTSRILELEEEVNGLKNARDARTAELEEELKALKNAREARTGELEEELRQLKQQHAARTAELEEEVRELKAVHEVRAAALEELRALNAAQEARVTELERERREVKSARKARTSELEELRAVNAAHAKRVVELEHALEELNTAQSARSVELDGLRALNDTQGARVAELEHQLKEHNAAQGARTAELDELRSRNDAQGARVAELEHEVRVLRVVLQDANASELAVVTGLPAESEADIETAAEWITNAPPGLEVTIEIDSNDDAEDFGADATAAGAETNADLISIPAAEPVAAVVRNFDVSAATQGRRKAPAQEREAATVAIAELDARSRIEVDASDETTTFGTGRADSDSTPVFEPNDHAESHESMNADDSATTTQVDSDVDTATASRDSDITTEFELTHAVSPLPSPETTLEIDPDSDLFELDAVLPPLSMDTPPAAASGKRKARKPRKPATKQRSVPRDDFQRIDGIGKSLEQRLHAKGIRTYAQLAALRAPDLARVAKQIGVTPERITREAWVPQARRLKKRAPKRPPAEAAKPRKPKRASA